jgi:hypothetical protein
MTTRDCARAQAWAVAGGTAPPKVADMPQPAIVLMKSVQVVEIMEVRFIFKNYICHTF